MQVKCKNPKCHHEWNYTGKSEWYTQCPQCKNQFNVRKAKIELGITVEKEDLKEDKQ